MTAIDNGLSPMRDRARYALPGRPALLAERTGIPPRVLDLRFWNRGQAPEYKAVPRHRTRCVYY